MRILDYVRSRTHYLGLRGAVWGGVLLACLSVSGAGMAATEMAPLAVTQNVDGQLEIFKVDGEGELWRRWQKEGEAEWPRWISLGGWILPSIAAGQEADGRLVVFAIDKASRMLRYKWQWNAKHPDWDWSTWTTLGSGTFQPPLVVGQNLDGRLELFALDAATGVLKHAWETNASGGWSQWMSLGAALQPGFAVGGNRSGGLELFGVDPTNQNLVHCAQAIPNDDQSWGAWDTLGGKLLSRLAVGTNADGSLEVFGLSASERKLLCFRPTPAGVRAGWPPGAELGRAVKPGVAIGQRANRGLEIFAVDDKSASMLHCYQTNPADPASWSGWKSLGGSVVPPLAVGRHSDGNLEVFAVDAGNPAKVNHRRQISENTGWLDWLNMDQPVFQYASRIWQLGEGLPHNEVQAIAQTPDGYLWIGTRGGLACFDGINFNAFTGKNAPEIKNDSVSALCVDQAGALWIGTEGGGLVCLKDHAFSRFCRADGLAGDYVTALCPDKNGSLWIGTTEGLSCLQGGVFSNRTQKAGLLSNLIRTVCQDDQGALWIGTDRGLNRLSQGATACFTVSNGFPNDSLRAAYSDRGGRLWLGTDNGLAWHNQSRFFCYDTQSGLADRMVSAIFDDRHGTLWVGTYGGLNRFHEGRFINELNSEGLPYDKINAIFEDREGNLWVGSNEGLIRFTPKRFFCFTKRQGLTHNNVMAVMEDRVRNVWIGTWGGGLDKLRGEFVSAFKDFSNDYVLSLCEAREGIWIGSDFEGGLAKFQSNRFRYYTWKDGLIRAGLRVLHEDRGTNLWIGTDKGLCRLRDGKFATFGLKDGLAGESVQAICETADGTLWFGTDRGLSCRRDGVFTNPAVAEGLANRSVTALYEDAERSLWIGTGSAGLRRLAGGRLTAYTTREGLFSDEIFEILEDDYGWLWMSSSRGVFRLRKSDLDAFDQHRSGRIVSIAYGKADGMESTQCNGVGKPAAWKASDGKLWFATTKGLVGVDPKIAIQNAPPPVFIEQLIADGGEVVREDPSTGIRGKAGVGLAPAGADPGVRLRPGRGEMEFHYTALNFQTPEKTRFRYQLEGVDRDWVDADRRRVAYYNNLYPGNYRFRVVACNSDGVWNETGAALVLTLLPHFWQTWWFYTAVAVGGVGTVGGVARAVTKARMQKKLEALRQQHAIERERGRIARDIHDELGSSLTRILLMGRRTQRDMSDPEQLSLHVGRIVHSATATVQSLDEIVWAVDPKKDTLDHLVGYITQYVNQYFEDSNVRCRLEMPANVPALVLPAEVRHNVFLVVKEALNNTLKHAQASEVHVSLSASAGAVTIGVEDNGCGFNVEQALAEGHGNGLENMRRRVESLGGTFNLVTVPGKGTQLRFQFEVVPPSQEE